MTLTNTRFTVSYSDERGNSVEHNFTDRAVAETMFQMMLPARSPAYRRAVPGDLAEWNADGWDNDTEFQRSTSFYGYSEEFGNFTVSIFVVGTPDAVENTTDYPWGRHDETLGACGCTDYHMADCPTRTGHSDGWTEEEWHTDRWY